MLLLQIDFVRCSIFYLLIARSGWVVRSAGRSGAFCLRAGNTQAYRSNRVIRV